MAEKKVEGGLWAVIPAPVRRDDHLPPNAKLLYGDLSALTYETGYCYASNEYLAGLYNWTERTVQRLLAALEEREFVRIEQIPGKERRIFCGVTVWAGPPTKMSPHPRQKSRGTPDKNVTPHNNVDKDIDKDIDNTPLTPQGGRSVSTPKWDPEGFEKFWTYYRTHARGENRAGAVKEWDKLKPDKDLIRTMGQALMAQTERPDWRRGIGIPHMKQWLKDRRWEDVLRDPAPAEEPEELTVEDRGLKVWE